MASEGYESLAVGRDGDELDLALDLAGADEVGHEQEAALEHADKQRVLVLEPVIELVAELLYARLDLLLAEEHPQKVLIHCAFCHSFSLLLPFYF